MSSSLSYEESKVDSEHLQLSDNDIFIDGNPQEMKQQYSSNYNKINDNNYTSVNDVLPNNTSLNYVLPNNTSINDVLPNNTSINDVLPNNTSLNDVLPNNNDSNNNNGNRESFVRPLNTEWITQRKKRGNRNVNVNGNDDDWNVESVNIYNSLHVEDTNEAISDDDNDPQAIPKLCNR